MTPETQSIIDSLEQISAKKSEFSLGSICALVDLVGLEPMTSSMPWRRSPN